MKIAIIQVDLAALTGGPRLAYALARQLIKRGHKVVLYTTALNREFFPELVEGLDIRVVPMRRELDSFFGAKTTIGKIFNKARYIWAFDSAMERIANMIDPDVDIVNCHDDTYRAGGEYLKRNPRTKVIWTMNGAPFSFIPKGNPFLDFPYKIYLRWRNFSEKKYFSVVSHVLVLDESNKKWAKDRGLNVSILWSGVDYEKYFSAVKREIKRPIRILCVGSLGRVRRYEDVIEAVGLTNKRGYDTVLRIIARDNPNENTYKEELLSLIEKLGFKDKIRIEFDGVSDDQLVVAYKNSDIFILAIFLAQSQSRYSWGLVAFEAMAAGLPLIVCTGSGAADVLKNNIEAIMFDPARVDQISDAIVSLANDTEKYSSIALNGQKFTKEKISWGKYGEKMEQICFTALSENK